MYHFFKSLSILFNFFLTIFFLSLNKENIKKERWDIYYKGNLFIFLRATSIRVEYNSSSEWEKQY